MGAKVDTWDMVLVHKMFRREFAALPGLVRAVAAGDRARAETVGGHAAVLTRGLHHHHTGEDEMLWPPLLSRIGELDAELVRRMETQHEVVSSLLERIDPVLIRWRAGADEAGRDELAALIAELSVALDEHLDDEENHILPLVSEHVTQAEWTALGEHGQSGIPKGRKGLVALGAILQDATPDERTRFMALLPALVRLIWRTVGVGIYRKDHAKLYGAAAEIR
jgi:iron-sulfur cluster repair protein YtfE (RIC family)